LFIKKKKEIEPRCAEALCRLFPSDPAIDIIAIATKAKQNKKRYSSGSQSRSPVSLPASASSSSGLPLETSSLTIKRQTSKDIPRRSSPTTKYRPSSDASSNRRHYHHDDCQRQRSPSDFNRHRSDVTLYFIIIRLTTLAIIFSTNLIQYRTFKTGVG
jgi:hypothetical protein